VRDPDKQRIKLQRLGVSMRSSAAAEKGDEGMALKIRTRAEDMPDGKKTPLK
jgi:hypothetical protein